MKTCDMCGTALRGGICPYCEEELFILEHQVPEIDAEYIPEFSDEFMTRAEHQRIHRDERDKEIAKRKEEDKRFKEWQEEEMLK